jgi:hypothetical protein
MVRAWMACCAFVIGVFPDYTAHFDREETGKFRPGQIQKPVYSGFRSEDFPGQPITIGIPIDPSVTGGDIPLEREAIVPFIHRKRITKRAPAHFVIRFRSFFFCTASAARSAYSTIPDDAHPRKFTNNWFGTRVDEGNHKKELVQ